MSILIFEPELLYRTGYNGFYRHFLSALVKELGARPTDLPRPRPRMTQPREHESCWVEWDGMPVFFDMSDHVHLFDLEALKVCGVYFKANLHWGVARRILTEAGATAFEQKLAPFAFFADTLDFFLRVGNWRRILHLDRPRYDVCFIMGVYDNPIRRGEGSPFEFPAGPLSPASYHFWVRWHILDALKGAGITGYYRLTSRANPAIEDGHVVQPNLSKRAYSWRITRSRMMAVCTLPHGVFPWKASEALALGRPLLVDQMPRTDLPPPFRPRVGEHVLELLPETGDFNLKAPWSEPESYRVLARISLERFRERAEWLRSFISARHQVEEMMEASRHFAAHAYSKKTIATYILQEVQKRR